MRRDAFVIYGTIETVNLYNYQLDVAFQVIGYEPGGREFESLRARQIQ